MSDSDDISTENFSSALQLTYPSDGGQHIAPPNVRREAEAYLIRLQNSHQGLDLASHIICNEDFSPIRAFWAFNVVIHHISNNTIDENSIPQLYNALFGWLRRTSTQQQVPDFVRNKHAQVMVVGVHQYYPHAWPRFFADLFDLLELRNTGGDQIVFYFLHVFDCIDQQVVARGANRGPKERARDNAIKDQMRIEAVPQATEIWLGLIWEYQNKNVDLVLFCLSVVKNFIEWIDVALLLADAWINLLYLLLSAKSLAMRTASVECLVQLVGKKQLPQVKYATLQSMKVHEAIPRIVDGVMSTPPSTEEELAYCYHITQFAVGTATQLCTCVEKDNIADCTDVVHLLFPHIINLARLQKTDDTAYLVQDVMNQHDPSIEHWDQRRFSAIYDFVLPFLQQYVRSSIITEKEAESITEVVHNLTLLPDYNPAILHGVDEEGYHNCLVDIVLHHTEFIELRKQLYILLRLLLRKHPSMLTFYCSQVIEQCTVSSDACAAPTPQAEAALRLLFELGEGMKMELLKDSNNAVAKMVFHAVSSSMAKHPAYVVSLAYVETIDRFYHFFVFHSDLCPLLLEQLLELPCGVTNRNALVRNRVCYLFPRIMHVLKPQFSHYSSTIVNTLAKLLLPQNTGAVIGGTSPSPSDTSPLAASDKGDLFEGLGNLLGVADLGLCAQVVGNIVADMHGVTQAATANSSNMAKLERYANRLADDIFFLTCFVKGVGGVDATRMPDSPIIVPNSSGSGSNNPLFPAADAFHLPSAVNGGSNFGPNANARKGNSPGAGADGCGPDADSADSQSAAFFTRVTQTVQEAVGEWIGNFASVRDKYCLFMHQAINILDKRCLPFIAEFAKTMFPAVSENEVSKLLRVLLQTVSKTRGGCAELFGTLVIPSMVERVSHCADISSLHTVHGVVSESTKEQHEIFKHYFCLLHAIVTSSTAIAAFDFAPSQNCMQKILTDLTQAIYSNGNDLELARLSLQIICRMTHNWLSENSPIADFLSSSALPNMLDAFTLKSFDLEDGKTVLLTNEGCQLLKTVVQRLGEGGAAGIRDLMLKCVSQLGGGQDGSAEEQAITEFCVVLRDSERANSMVKTKFRGVLEGIRHMRIAANPGAQT